jgi:hypothetical protein
MKGGYKYKKMKARSMTRKRGGYKYSGAKTRKTNKGHLRVRKQGGNGLPLHSFYPFNTKVMPLPEPSTALTQGGRKKRRSRKNTRRRRRVTGGSSIYGDFSNIGNSLLSMGNAQGTSASLQTLTGGTKIMDGQSINQPQLLK